MSGNHSRLRIVYKNCYMRHVQATPYFLRLVNDFLLGFVKRGVVVSVFVSV
jgi:hypothetical protein